MKQPNKNLIWIILAAILALDIFLWLDMAAGARPASVQYHFLSVGQGDSELIIIPASQGRNVKLLIDGGPDAQVLRQLGRILSPLDRYIDIVLLTHPQNDHAAGLIDVLENFQVGLFAQSGLAGTSGALKSLEAQLLVQRVPVQILAQGDVIKYGEAEIDILSPAPSKPVLATASKKVKAAASNLNESCLVALVRAGGHRALFTCDADATLEAALLKKYGDDLAADILKVAHHGSRFSSTAEFLAMVKPRIAVIEVGKNSYGHPTEVVLAHLAAIGAKMFRTDLQGNVLAQFGERGLEIYTEK